MSDQRLEYSPDPDRWPAIIATLTGLVAVTTAIIAAVTW